MECDDKASPQTARPVIPTGGGFLNTRGAALAAVAVVWAAIYLPLLGTHEYEVMEPMRVMPAEAMLQTGQWVLPRVVDMDYYNKPPGMNWLIAASFAVTGSHTEFTARLPSTVFVLAFAALLVWMPSSFLTLRARLAAALIFISTIGMADFGRRAEIDAVYSVLTGLATLWWLNIWTAGRSRWLLWIVPAILLAYGALVKGPLLGAFFYLTVGLVLLYHRRLRELFCLPHLAAIVLIIGLCLTWVYLAYRATDGKQMVSTWAAQWLLRVAPTDENAAILQIVNPLKSLGKLMPWILFVPLLWIRRFTANIPADRQKLFRAIRLAAAASFVLINALPYGQPRYSLPTHPLIALVLGWLLAEQRPPLWGGAAWKWGIAAVAALSLAALPVEWLLFSAAVQFWVVVAITVAIAGAVLWRIRWASDVPALVLAMAALVAPAMVQHESVSGQDYIRRVAKIINHSVPKGEHIHVFLRKDKSLLVCVYLRPPLHCVSAPKQIDADLRYVVISHKDWERPEVQSRLAGRPVRVLERFIFSDWLGEWLVLDLGPQPK